MFHLIVTACLAQDPSVCAPRLARVDFPDATTCAVATWSPPNLTISNPRCVETADLPALDLQPVADTVWVHSGAIGMASPENLGRIANLGVIVTPDGVTVIDPGASRAQAEALFAAIRSLTDLSVTQVIVTHMHPDHALGAGFFAENGAQIIAAQGMGQALQARADTYLGRYADNIGKAEMSGTTLSLPQREINIPTQLGPLLLTPAPTAHTDNDLTVWYADEGVWFTGDLIFDGLTPTLDGSLRGWQGWLNAPPPPARVIVPGHGRVFETWDPARTPMVDYLDALADATRAALDARQPLSVAIPAIVAGVTDRVAAQGWVALDDNTTRNASAAYQELEWE